MSVSQNSVWIYIKSSKTIIQHPKLIHFIVMCMVKSFIFSWLVIVVSSFQKLKKKKKLFCFSENAKDKMGNLVNFLLKTYLIVAGRIIFKILSLELLSKIILDRWYFAKSSYIIVKFSNKYQMGISNIQQCI